MKKYDIFGKNLTSVAFLFILSLLIGFSETAGHINSIQSNVNYINYGYAKIFEFLFELEHELPTTGFMKIRLPFLIDDGTSIHNYPLKFIHI